MYSSSSSAKVRSLLMIRDLPRLRSIVIYFKIESETTSCGSSLTHLAHLLKELFFSERDALLGRLILLLLISLLSAITFRTIALMIITPAYIAEASTAAALHFIASMRLLHPIVTFGALLKFLSADKLHKLLIILIFLVCNFILFACLTTVIRHSTVQTIVFMAHLTLERAVTF